MASNSSAATNMDNTGAQMETVIIANVRYEVPKAVAELLKSSKSSSESNMQVAIYNPKSTRFVEYCAGVGEIGEKERIDVSVLGRDVSVGLMNTVGVDSVIEEVLNPEGVICSGACHDTEEEEIVIYDFEFVSSVLKNPGGVVDSDNTEDLFGCSQEKEDLSKETGEPSVVAKESKLDKTLNDLEKLKNTAKFQVTEDENDCEIVETSSTATKKRVSKPNPLRKQPVRVSKRKLEVKEENTTKSSVKKAKRSKSGKEILTEMECSEKLLLEEGLTEVYELLKAQGWEKLCETQESVCPEVVEEFYKNLSFIEGTIPALEVKFKGHKFILSSMELAMTMGLDHKGFDLFCKNNQWPKEAGDKQELVKRICHLEKVPKGSSISTQFMEPNVKILHKLLVSNFIQRGVKPSYVQHEDLLVLDRLLKKEKINLPKLMIHQMFHLKNLTQIGFSRVIKKVLQEHELYENMSGVEEQIVKEFDPDVFRKMNLVKDSVEGWIRAQVPEPGFGAKSGKDDGSDGDDLDKDAESGRDVDQWMPVLENNISDVKREIKAIRAELKGFKEEIKEEIKEVQDALLALVERL